MVSSSAWEAVPALFFGLTIVFAAWAWWKRRRADRYDLRSLRDAPRTGQYDQTPLLPGEEPEDDWVTEDSGPYCVSCDEAYAAGTPVCRRCGRPLG